MIFFLTLWLLWYLVTTRERGIVETFSYWISSTSSDSVYKKFSRFVFTDHTHKGLGQFLLQKEYIYMLTVVLLIVSCTICG